MEKFEEYFVKRIDKNNNLKGLLEYPSYVEIETVNACNARCPMCTINDWNRNYPVMKDDVFNKQGWHRSKGCIGGDRKFVTIMDKLFKSYKYNILFLGLEGED